MSGNCFFTLSIVQHACDSLISPVSPPLLVLRIVYRRTIVMLKHLCIMGGEVEELSLNNFSVPGWSDMKEMPNPVPQELQM